MHQVKIKNGPSSAKEHQPHRNSYSSVQKNRLDLIFQKNEEDYFRMPQTCFKENFKNPNEHAN